MTSENLLKKTGKKLWIIVSSDKDENELGLDKTINDRILILPKSRDSEALLMTVKKIAERKAETNSTG